MFSKSSVIVHLFLEKVAFQKVFPFLLQSECACIFKILQLNCTSLFSLKSFTAFASTPLLSDNKRNNFPLELLVTLFLYFSYTTEHLFKLLPQSILLLSFSHCSSISTLGTRYHSICSILFLVVIFPFTKYSNS